MELGTFFEIIEKYGWWSIAIAAGVGIVYILVKLAASRISNGVKDGMTDIGNQLTTSVTKQLQELSSSTTSQVEMLSTNIAKQNNDLIKAISGQNERLLSYLMHKDVAEEEIHDAKVEKRMDVAENIIDKLRDIMHITHSQRAFIIEFHNSYKNLSGTPFAKYTCTYEWFDKGLDQISSRVSGLPYSTMAKIVGDVKRKENHQILYTNMEKMELDNPQLFSLVKDKRTTAVFYNMLYDEHNKMMGMLVIEWQLKNFREDVFYDAKMPKILSEESLLLSTWLNLQGPSIESEEID